MSKDNAAQVLVPVVVENNSASLSDQLEQFQCSLIANALRESGGNKTLAARALGMKRTTLIERCKALDINFDEAPHRVVVVHCYGKQPKKLNITVED